MTRSAAGVPASSPPPAHDRAMRTMRHTLVSVRDFLSTTLPFIALASLLLVGAYWLLDPTPPRRVVLATGAPQSAYAEFGQRYAAELKRYGIDVVLRETEGSSENLRLLRDPAQIVDLAFVQGGSGQAIYAVDEDTSGVPLVSLGSLFYEPVWAFYRAPALAATAAAAGSARAAVPARGATSTGRAPADAVAAVAPFTQLAQFNGLRVNLGTAGSGVPNLMAKLLNANRIELSQLRVSALEQTPAVSAFVNGDLDAVVFASAPESVMVQMLLQAPGVKLFDFAQAEAYARRFPFLSALNLPRGVVDLAGDIPPRDVRLVATTTSLVARESTHPAIMQLFVQAAQTIHGGTGWFHRAGQFPTTENTELPIAAEAQRFFRSGAPLLQRYLPFWLANLIDRMWVALLSIVAILIPLSRILPPLYALRIRSRVFRWYAQLREIENAIGSGHTPREQLLAQLDALDLRVEHIAVPLSYADELYALRGHIDLVRERLRQGGGGATPSVTAVPLN